jgi:hypothetical protein
VKIVAIPYEIQRDAVGTAIEMSHWCKDMGLVQDQDYDWSFLTHHKEIHFRFFGKSESVSSMFLLKWAGHEV